MNKQTVQVIADIPMALADALARIATLEKEVAELRKGRVDINLAAHHLSRLLHRRSLQSQPSSGADSSQRSPKSL